jgi:hypothetical protein
MREKPDANGFLASRALADGRLLAVVPLTHGRARLTVGRGVVFYDDGW